MNLSRLPWLPSRLPAQVILAPATRRSQTGSHMTQDPEMWEHEKKKVLEGKAKSPMKEAPGWDMRLASVSEAVVGWSVEGRLG